MCDSVKLSCRCNGDDPEVKSEKSSASDVTHGSVNNDVSASQRTAVCAGRSATAAEAVLGLSRALLQVSQMIEPKFLQKPLGEDEATRTRKQKEAVELQLQGLTPSKIKEQVWEGKRDESAPAVDDDTAKRTAMERWQDALMNSSSLSQVFLLLSTLERSITWDKSALLARCTVCHRKGDDERMLLCDGCDLGYHIYCLKPPLKVGKCAVGSVLSGCVIRMFIILVTGDSVWRLVLPNMSTEGCAAAPQDAAPVVHALLQEAVELHGRNGGDRRRRDRRE